MAWSAARIRWLWVLVVGLLVATASVASWAEAQRASEASQPRLVPLVGLLLGAAAAAMSMEGVVAVHSGEKWGSNVLMAARMGDLTLCRPVFPAHYQ